MQRRQLSDLLVDSPPHEGAKKRLEEHRGIDGGANNLITSQPGLLPINRWGKAHMMRVLSPVLSSDRKVPRNERDGQAYDACNLETDVAPHRKSWFGAMYQEPRAYDGSRGEDEKCEGCEQAMDEDEAVVVCVASVPITFA